jgi:hypothetical protein
VHVVGQKKSSFTDVKKSNATIDKGILKRTQNEQGLAEVAITWFWKRHANYISTAKKVLEDLTIPIQILNKKMDHIVGYGSQARALRLQASLDAKIMLASGIVGAAIGMPKSSEESDHSSSDSDLRLTPPIDDSGEPLVVSSTVYSKAVEEVSKNLESDLKSKLKQAIEKEALNKLKDHGVKP